jgi:vacuolar-type H+-ATPase subunit I/STV1
MSDKMALFELKEKAKWSSDSEERKTAIKELSTHGENAILELQEIMNITAYEDIKNACAEAIKSIQARSKVEVNETSTNDSNSAADVTTTKDQKKEKFEKEAESALETGVRLADLPP